MLGSLQVYLLDYFVGWLSFESRGNRFAFKYDERYLLDPAAGALSYSLPLRNEPFDSDVTENFFANLLPPAVVRKRLGPCLHLSRHNIFGFLKALGGDCAGAVALYPEGMKPPPPEKVVLRELSADEASDLLKSLPQRPLYAAGEKGYRYSGAGAQDKLIVRVQDGKVLLPLEGTPSTHIIKPGTKEFGDSVHNEHFCQTLANRIKLSAAECSILTLKGALYYVSTRYDRQTTDGLVRRLHQEDFCQILSVDPELKYEEDGGPTIPQCFEALRRLRVNIADQLAFMDAVIYNYLVGNADAHAKNYSVLYSGSKPHFAPIYDTVCTVVYPHLAHDFAMKIGGDSSFDKITRDSFARMAAECRTAPALMQARLDALAAKIGPEAAKLADECTAQWPSDVYARIVEVIKEQVARVR